MEPLQQPGTIQVLAPIIEDMAHAICQRPGENAEQRLTRAKVATRAILSFEPRDVIETMLAGHSVMFHAVLTDSIQHTLRGEIDKTRRGSRANIVALDKAFHLNLHRLARYQTRPSAKEAEEAVPQEAQTEAATEASGPPVAGAPIPFGQAPEENIARDAELADIPAQISGDSERSATTMEMDRTNRPCPAATAGPPARHNGGQAGAGACPLPQHPGLPTTVSPPQLNRAQRRAARRQHQR